MYKQAIANGILFAALAVIIGAFGAHYLKSIFSSEQLISFETGVKYQFYHAFALLFTGVLGLNFSTKFLKIATWLFSIGIIFFSGSIYLLNFLASKDIIGLIGLGIITPIGGLLLIAGWCCLGISILKHKPSL